MGNTDDKDELEMHSLGKLNREDSLGLNFDTLAPELELRMDRAMKIPVFRVGIEGGHWRMVRHLLAHYPVGGREFSG